ncbi:MAG: hypothetical protein J3R72DRAFT_494944 [Linnemannia gamsii]|nr:MAG: hypothetical protein J3R72DRAFT_494944 [Linnemannia gamsii]
MAVYFQASLDVGVKARTALIAIIYHKSLKLSSAAKRKIFAKAKVGKFESMDGHICIMNEILSGIKIFKLYGWEESFKERIAFFRHRELSSLRKIGTFFSFMPIMFQSMSLMSPWSSPLSTPPSAAPTLDQAILAPRRSMHYYRVHQDLARGPSVPIEIKDGVFAWKTEGPKVETSKEKRIREKQETKNQAQLEKEAR